MSDCMTFPNNWREFLKDYSFKDTEEVYTNGAELIPVFRVEQLIEHLLAKQEPRVLTLEEVRDEYEVVWLETKYLLPPTVCLVDGESNVDWLYFAFGSDNSYGVSGRLYGKNWRCWSAKPTDEQREAVPWND